MVEAARRLYHVLPLPLLPMIEFSSVRRSSSALEAVSQGPSWEEINLPTLSYSTASAIYDHTQCWFPDESGR
ncbi:hypothetical protein C8Q76DRAFT_164828 [Earliella scabrosa]|nr:hypothetical protein C8Q76DRAFT_164828 [Earliella scabrosa]